MGVVLLPVCTPQYQQRHGPFGDLTSYSRGNFPDLAKNIGPSSTLIKILGWICSCTQVENPERDCGDSPSIS